MVNYSKNIFITSAIIAVLIFVAGLILGFSLDSLRISEVSSNLNENDLETESYFVQQQFIEAFGGDKCTILSSRIKDMKFQVSKIGRQLGSYSSKGINIEENLDFLKRKYFISEIKFLILLNDLNKNCNKNYIPLLFFYTKDSTESSRQGAILTDLSEVYNESLIILSIDKDYEDEHLVNTLKIKYNITKQTTMVLNNQLKMEGLITKETLIEKIDSLL